MHCCCKVRVRHCFESTFFQHQSVICKVRIRVKVRVMVGTSRVHAAAEEYVQSAHAEYRREIM